MARLILSAAIAWPLLLASAWWQHVHGVPQTWSLAVYVAASRVCHQQPARSIHVAGVPSPVCGRCTGLYAGGAFAAVIGPYAMRGRRRRGGSGAVVADAGAVRRMLLVAAVPTVLTIAAEWIGLPVTTTVRTLAALPLGAALVVTVMGALPTGPAKPIG